MLSDSAARKIFIASGLFLLTVLAFLAGWAVRQYQIWPYALLDPAIQAVRSVKTFGEIIPEGRRVLAPRYAAREKFKVHDAARVNAGYYAFVGFDPEISAYAAWLYDGRGKRLHRWVLDYRSVDAGWTGESDMNPHGIEVLEDGSILVTFDKGRRMARLDACSRPLWTKDGIYHHLMARAEDGSYWAWRGKDSPYGQFQYLENFDARTGRKLKELGLVEDLIKNLGPASIVFSLRPDFPFGKERGEARQKIDPDLFHPNDVDVLTAALAPQFPMFAVGDLLLSFRSTNLVVVVDPEERKVRWWRRGPWSSQHDPDFVAGGRISVYDNNTGRGRSEIVSVDPATGGVVHELFTGAAKFYSANMGVHQYLPNGDVLIAVPGEGRVIEVAPDGNYVLEFNNLAPGWPGYNEHIENAVWISPGYFPKQPGCPRPEESQ